MRRRRRPPPPACHLSPSAPSAPPSADLAPPATRPSCAHSKIKFWDLRNGRSPEQLGHIDAAPAAGAPADAPRVRGFCCLDVDPAGLRLLGGCTGGKVHLYDLLRPGAGPTHTLEGHSSETFYVKAVFSPDGRHVASGSSDKRAYLWDVQRPSAPPVRLAGHAGEVTTLDFCHDATPSLRHSLASCSDDGTVRVWEREDLRERTFITPRRPARARGASPARAAAEAEGGGQRPGAPEHAPRSAAPLVRVRTIDDFWRAPPAAQAGAVQEGPSGGAWQPPPPAARSDSE